MAGIDEIVQLGLVEELEEVVVGNVPRRHFRRDLSAFVHMSEELFRKTFRLSKNTARQLIDMVAPFVDEPRRASALDVERKVMIALRFFASGSYQLDIGLNIYTSVSQASVSRCVGEITNILNNPVIFNNWVKFPQNIEELAAKRDEFYRSFQFPGVVGCIDCTHVAIIAPNAPAEHVYVNRKSYHSINVQLVCDSKCQILNVNSLYPGSTHDVFIWDNSHLRSIIERIYEAGHKGFWLLGDSGYPLRPWLLKPLEYEPEEGTPEYHYNVRHKSTRSIIERCNGLLKMRFRCLLKHRVLHYAPEKASQIVNACVVLHNMCISNNEPDPPAEEEDQNIDLGMIVNTPIPEEAVHDRRRVNPLLTEGRKIQRRIIMNYFSRN